VRRRQFLKSVGASLVCWYASPVFSSSIKTKPKLVWILLRGAMDGIHAVCPLNDDNLFFHRRKLAEVALKNAYPLDSNFVLNSALKNFSELYKNGELLPIIATESGAETRSHFRAQDILESGYKLSKNDSGWLNRAVKAYQGNSLAVSHSLPISLRGDYPSQTWYPDNFIESTGDLYQRLQYLYEYDPELYESLNMGLSTKAQLGDTSTSKGFRQFSKLASSCGKLMYAENGPDCSMLELSGWDTHQQQSSRLHRKFSQLDQGLASLRESLKEDWNNTVVIIATEFGRTVAENGTGGTDHGTASTLFLAGGAVDGGKVEGKWPGLSKESLFEGRDLAPTSDSREWIASVLKQHWYLNDGQINDIFPGITPVNKKIIRA
jgi:uncharacterized protein (DUF1501 family)